VCESVCKPVYACLCIFDSVAMINVSRRIREVTCGAGRSRTVTCETII